MVPPLVKINTSENICSIFSHDICLNRHISYHISYHFMTIFFKQVAEQMIYFQQFANTSFTKNSHHPRNQIVHPPPPPLEHKC